MKTSWKDLLKAFISSDSESGKQESEEEFKFDIENREILARSRKNIENLETMFKRPDLSVKNKGRQVRKQSRLKTKAKEQTMENSTRTPDRNDEEIER